MLVAGLKALKKVQGTAAGTAVRPGRAGRVQTLCRGPANGGIPGKATVGARLDDTESLLGGGGRAADRDEGQQRGGFGALSPNKRTTIKVLRDYSLA